MIIEARQITVGGVRVQVLRKGIKNLHLGVYPPDGRVRVAAPLLVSNEAVRLAVIGKLGWIKRQKARFAGQPRQSPRRMLGGESHYFLGRRYRLRVKEHEAAPRVIRRNGSTLELRVRPGSTTAQREVVMNKWYRAELTKLVPPLLRKWEPLLGVQAAEWHIKRMKTRWGTCNAEARRIWLNLELAKKPTQCLEYIAVHELTHLLEATHNERFVALMDKHLPDWRTRRAALNASPLAHEEWGY